MWTHEAGIGFGATRAEVCTVLSDTSGWKVWNAGIDSIELHGLFVNDTHVTMKPPGEDAINSTLVDVRENERFTDETVIDGTRVLVCDAIKELSSGHSRVTRRTEISRPATAQFGRLVTGDFHEVLQGLKRGVERRIGLADARRGV